MAHSDHGHQFLTISYRGQNYEAGVTYIIHHFNLPDGKDTPAICLEIVTVDSDVCIPHGIAKSALKRHLNEAA